MINPLTVVMPTPPDPATDSDDVFTTKATATTLAEKQFATELQTIIPQMNADIASVNTALPLVQLAADTAVNAPGSAGTSTTSLTIGIGTQNFTTQTGKAWQVGQQVLIAMAATPLNWMHGTITAYNSATGAMTVVTARSNGSGTAVSWVISLSGPAVAASTLGNAVVNGSCAVAQAGPVTLSGTGGSFYGGCDMFITQASGTTVSGTIQQGAASAGFQSKFTQQIASLITTGTTSMSCGVRLDSSLVKKYSGKTVVLSCKVRQNSGVPLNFSPSLSRASAVDNFGTVVLIASGAAVSVPSAVATTVSMSVALGANDADNGLQLTAQASGTVPIGGALIEWGDWYLDLGNTVPPVIEQPGPAIEFARCARYYYVTNYGNPTGAALPSGAHGGIAGATNVLFAQLRYPVTMRVPPTVTLWRGGTQNQVRVTATGATVAATLSGTVGGVGGFGAIVMSGTPLTVGTGYDFDIVADARL